MLTVEEKNYVIDILATWVGNQPSPRQALLVPFTNFSVFGQTLQSDTPRNMAIAMVNMCINDAWNNSPTWLHLLLDGSGLTIIDGRIVQILERSAIKPHPVADPYQAAVLNSNTPFINRASLRKQLQKLATPQAKMQPILLIDGQQQSGKSYSATYIDYFKDTHPASIITCPIEFEEELGPAMGAQQVARDLVFMMGRPVDDMPPPHTVEERYAQELALWVLNEAAQTNVQHWFVFDNFRGGSLRTDTRRFLSKFSASIVKGIFPQRCRLILIGIDRDVLATVDTGKIDEEMVSPCNLSDIEAVIQEILQLTPSVSQAAVTPFIVDNLPADSTKMAILNRRLRLLLVATNRLKSLLSNLAGVNPELVLQQMLDSLPAGPAGFDELKNRLNTLNETIQDLPRQ